ncbi:MAG: glycosyl transferase, partial [Mycobacteriaceae bacterium]|nr:glycosyl transferase [Mycobacteriaceae bacterium]
FMGGDPSPTLASFQQDVADGQIHYYIEGRGPGMPPSADAAHQRTRPETPGDQIAAWVQQHFTASTVDGVTYYDLTAPRSNPLA